MRPIEPAAEFGRLREHGPIPRVQWSMGPGLSSTAWLVTRYADVREVLGSPHVSNRFYRGGLVVDQPGFLLSLDPPEHNRIRRMLTREFSVKRVNALRPRVEQIVHGFLDDMIATGPPADLMQALALPVPSLVICELLGVPYDDREEFQRRSGLLLDPRATREEAMANTREMNDYMSDLVTRQRNSPGEDILGALVREHGAEVSDAELVGIGNILLIAGHETTANTIGLGTLLLIQHPEQLALVRDDPSVLRTAVEEVLRYLSIVHTGSPRRVTEDITVAGQPIPAGDMVVVSLPSANRDGNFLTDADSFDVTRPVGAHLAFGHGIHQCLGQQLARMELAVVLPAMLTKLPNLRLAARQSDLAFRTDGPVNGVNALPIAWG
ncbi:cytochrome P450 [Umezawaea endophytica]|uniref:Cytochrome P450 n=1 Tax=Umezawaea endophytica TaxID=1654476 RepID=A0A9X2VUH0_9PSEU|nr:cytochrome P450 [Umezawaea endophytica]MCS7482869.1 cytochrome P450 [Umezawaea endophytica]